MRELNWLRAGSSGPGLHRGKQSEDGTQEPGDQAAARTDTFPSMIAEDVALLHDQQLLAVDLDLGAGPFAEQHAVALLDVERHDLAGLVASARPDGDDLALHRLLFGGVGDDDPAGGLGVLFDAAHDHAVMQRAKLHGLYLTLFPTNLPISRRAAANEPPRQRYRQARSPGGQGASTTALVLGTAVSSVKLRVPMTRAGP